MQNGHKMNVLVPKKMEMHTFGLGKDTESLEDLTCSNAFSTALLPPIKFGCEVFI